MYCSTNYTSPLGEMIIVSDGEAVTALSFFNQKHFLDSVNGDIVENNNLEIFDKVIGWLDDYFNGINREIDFKLNPKGSDFQLKVWRVLSEIPYGETITYGEIARRISPTMFAQAVGGAVSRNPIAIVIPCHRVIGSDGSLTGYAGGIDRKIRLLDIENIRRKK